jgi:ElaB/YqjD/DUF883 family membrane-anchored ribosome-binding protein
MREKRGRVMNKSFGAAFAWKSPPGATVMAQNTSQGASDTLSNLKDQASDQFGKVTDQLEGVANRVAEQGREATEGMQELAENFKGALDRSIKDQPMATLAGAAMVGFVLGALWKS